MSDKVRLIVDGTEFTGWEGVSVESNIDSIADAFAVSSPFNPDNRELVSRLKPDKYALCKLYIDDELIITGRIESSDTETSSGGRKITVQGRSLPGILVDCSIITTERQWTGLYLSTIARRLCSSYEISVTGDADVKLSEVTAGIGEKVAEFLSRNSSPSKILLSSDPSGRLVMSRLDASSSPVAALVEGEWPLVSVKLSYDGTARYSRYTVCTQFAGEPDITGVADDSGVPIRRETVEAIAEGEDLSVDFIDPNVTARMRRGQAYARSHTVSCVCAGWRRKDGRVWRKGDVVTLNAPGAFILTEWRYVIAGVTLSFDSSAGAQAALSLVDPATFNDQMPEGAPWD